MASFQLTEPMTFVTLEPGMTISFEAIDPDTGAAVSGVVISQACIFVTSEQPDSDEPDAPESLTWAPVLLEGVA